MNFNNKALKPTSVVLAFLVLLVPVFHQTASAAMIGNETMLTLDRTKDTRGYLHNLMSREAIQQVLVARGINPLEAKARIDSLSDDELEMIAGKITDLPAGGDVTGFIVIVGAVIIIAIILVEYFSEVKMFPQLHSDQ
jgi:hypothetical protein